MPPCPPRHGAVRNLVRLAHFCVSTVSIRQRTAELKQSRAPRAWSLKEILGLFRRRQQPDLTGKSAPSVSLGAAQRDLACRAACPGLEGSRWLTVLTVLTVLSCEFSCAAVIRMIRVPPRPSRLKVISMPSARSDVCARRSRPASARGDFGQPELLAQGPSGERSAPIR